MDRITPLGLSVVFYSALGFLNYRFTSCPEELCAPNKAKEYRDFYGQHISLVHAWITVLLAMYVYILEGGVDYIAPTNQLHIIVLAHSLGYFIYDTCYAEYFEVHDAIMRLHHVLSVFGGFSFYFSEIGGSPATVCLLFGELSNPWIMKRHIMRTKGQEHYLMFTVYEYIFAVTFLLVRSIGFTFVTHNLWASEITVLAKITASALFAIGLFWCFIIVGMLHKKLKKEKEEPGWGVSLLWCLTLPLKKCKMGLITFLIFFAGVLPFYLTQFLRVGYIHLRVDNTILL